MTKSGKIWVFGGDSDAEYTEYDDELEMPGKLYNMRTKDAIAEKALRRHIHLGIPRRKGYYQLQTLNSSRARPSGHFYSGHHWDVGPVMMGDIPRQGGMGTRDDEQQSTPLVLEHTTRRLTLAAINRAVDAEQIRRSHREAREKEIAARLYSPINNEFFRLIAFNMDEDKKETRSYHTLVESEKEDVLQQLLHHKNQETADDMMERERNRRVSLMDDLTDSDKCCNDMALLKTLKGLSKAAKMIQLLQQELMGACNDLEEVSNEEDHAVEDLFLELKDDFVASYKRATLLMKFHMLEENEKRRRMSEARAYFTGKKELDRTQKCAMQNKGLMEEEMTRIFASVIQDTAQRDIVLEDKSQTIKEDTQVQLLHRLHTRQADKACDRERSRRIKDMENELRGGCTDALKEHVKDVVMVVQEEMLVQRFHGKKVMFRKAPEQVPQHYEGETAQDRKLRSARMKSRRQSCVVSGF